MAPGMWDSNCRLFPNAKVAMELKHLITLHSTFYFFFFTVAPQGEADIPALFIKFHFFDTPLKLALITSTSLPSTLTTLPLKISVPLRFELINLSQYCRTLNSLLLVSDEYFMQWVAGITLNTFTQSVCTSW